MLKIWQGEEQPTPIPPLSRYSPLRLAKNEFSEHSTRSTVYTFERASPFD